jgi:hypothetical protein
MKKMKLGKLPDRLPVKLQITLAPDLAARLRDYAELYEQTYGVREEPADLVPFMLDAFLDSDPEFRRVTRTRNGKGADGEESATSTRMSSSDDADCLIRELRRPRSPGPAPPSTSSDS